MLLESGFECFWGVELIQIWREKDLARCHTLLYHAVAAGRANTVKLLLENGVDPDSVGQELDQIFNEWARPEQKDTIWILIRDAQASFTAEMEERQIQRLNPLKELKVT